MTKYVNIDELIQEINRLPFAMSVCLTTDECEGMLRARRLITSIIQAMPPSEVRELVRATKQPVDEQPYFRKRYHRICCSNCHREVNKDWQFCPDCGAFFGSD